MFPLPLFLRKVSQRPLANDDAVAKCWVRFDGTGSVSIAGSYNVSSITDNGTGDYTVNIATDNLDANYSAVASTARTGVPPIACEVDTYLAGSYNIQCYRVDTEADVDSDTVSSVAFGVR